MFTAALFLWQKLETFRYQENESTVIYSFCGTLKENNKKERITETQTTHNNMDESQKHFTE